MADTEDVKIGPRAVLALYRNDTDETVEIVLYKTDSDVDGTFLAMRGDLEEYALVKTLVEAAASNLAIEFREERSDA